MNLGQQFNASKYKLGNNPCYQCQKSRHKKCRPRRDNTLCSCNCERATWMREEIQCAISILLERGETVPDLRTIINQFVDKSYRMRLHKQEVIVEKAFMNTKAGKKLAPKKTPEHNL